MEQPKEELIRVGAIELRFFVDGTRSAGSMDMFEMTVPPAAKVPAAHYHKEVDELVYGLEGVLTYTIDGEKRELKAGDRCFVPRGTVHHFINLQDVPARALTVLTPAKIGPQYFRAIGELVAAGGPPDLAKVRAVMERHGLVPA